MALTKEGFVYTWGANDKYQLGDGTTVTRTQPVLVVGSVFGPDEKTKDVITLIAAGRTHAIAYSETSNTYYSWGTNINGELGNGTLKSYIVPVNASQISVLLNQKKEIPQALYAGDQTTFVWAKSGAIYAFGLNSNGQLGESSQTNQLLGNNVDSSAFNGSVITFCVTYQHGIFITNNVVKNQLSLGMFIIIILQLFL